MWEWGLAFVLCVLAILNNFFNFVPDNMVVMFFCFCGFAIAQALIKSLLNDIVDSAVAKKLDEVLKRLDRLQVFVQTRFPK